MNNEPGREPTEPTDAELPSFDECEAAVMAMDATPLQVFIFDNEPAGEDCSLAFRAGLSAVIKTGQRPMPDTPAPDEVERLRAEVVEQSATITRQFELLKGVANVLKWQAGETELWSHADLPEMATRLTARVAGLEVVVDAAVKWLDRNGPDADIDLAGVVGDYVSEQTMRRINAAPRKGADQ